MIFPNKKSMRYFAQQALRWKVFMEVWEHQKMRIPKDSWFQISYEMLVSDPKGSLQDICSFLNLVFEQEMINYKSRAGDPVLNYNANLKRAHRNLAREFDQTRIVSWQELPRLQVLIVEELARTMMHRLGYTTCKNAALSFHRIYIRAFLLLIRKSLGSNMRLFLEKRCALDMVKLTNGFLLRV